MAQARNRHSIYQLPRRPTFVALPKSPFRIVRVAGDHLDRVTYGYKALCQAGRVRGVTRRLRAVVKAEDCNTKLLSIHACKTRGKYGRTKTGGGTMTNRIKGAPPIPRVVDLSEAPGERQSWNRPALVVYFWAAVELLFVTNPWQVSSGLRVLALRAFGADIGQGVVFRPRTRVKFPWKLKVGDRSWIGEGVWIHNQDQVTIGHDAVVSQETLITTGSHAHRTDMALITRPVHIDEGVWITARCVITGGVRIGRSALVKPMTVVSTDVQPGVIFGSAPPQDLGPRFPGASGKDEKRIS